MSRASAKSIRSGVTSPPNSERSLKTGFLVSAFKDSDDMEGKKFKTDSQYIVTYLVELCLRHRYQTVMVERRRP